MTNPNHIQRSESGADRWSVARVLKWATDDLKKRGSETPRLDVELLLGHALSMSRVELIVQHERPLTDAELASFKQLFLRRRAGEPIAYILGSREFYGFDVRIDSRVLVPRPDTETLVEVALERTRACDMYGRALDLCTGSGCVALALALRRRTWRVVGSDVSEAALAVARENALRLGVARNIHFVKGDLFEAFDRAQRFELIVANPPYIPSGEIAGLMRDVREFEPRLALDGGPDGLAVLRGVIKGARGYLSSGGVLACEIGAGQSEAVLELFRAFGYQAIQSARDYGGHERVISATLD